MYDSNKMDNFLLVVRDISHKCIAVGGVSIKRIIILFSAVWIMVCGMTACNGSVNDKIMEAYGLKKETSSVPPESEKTVTGADAAQIQEEIASGNAEEIYDEYSSKIDSEYYSLFDDVENAGKDDRELSERLLDGYYQFYAGIKSWAPVIAISSIGAGLLILIFSRYNKGLRRFGLYGLVIGVPLVLLVIVYGVGFLNGIFFY